ncbi:hypothetical protein BJ508DRAFT_410048 [Ascobolus immersus RN42]|uniref:Uncharacterized protein n=1 Tax=Ascobolus immersus RN42 TaxID=1160509 RepID=A0A3N4J2R6_ASCIM|nr:hypothetical protein BJ508DRAFT_410048 [Ascobolus immersus RN42]
MSVVVPALLVGLCALAAILLLRTFLPLRTTPQYILFPVFLAISIPCSIGFLVPIDIASHAGTDGRGIALSDRTLLVSWRIAYWLTFVLTWAILPLLQSYMDSGHRDPKRRFIAALHANMRYHLTILSLGTVGLIYFFFTSGFHLYSLKGLVIALGHCYALTLGIFLMGHGLVAVPRNLFRDASVSGKLRRLHIHAPKVHDSLLDANAELEDLRGEIASLKARRTAAAKEFHAWIDAMAEKAGVTSSTIATAPTTSTSALPWSRRNPQQQVITEEYLAATNRRLRIAVHKRDRYQSEWESLVQAAAEEQAILDSAASKRLVFPTPYSTSRFKNLPFLSSYTRHILHLYIIPQLRRGLGLILGLSSICIVWSEIFSPILPKLSVVGYTVVHHPNSEKGKIGFAGQAIAAFWIAYMCACALTSMKSVKVWGGYALVHRKTSPGSACFYASYACRLTVPLSFNFLMFLPRPVAHGSTFYAFLGSSINLTPLGEGFSKFFPILILLPIAATLFNFYGKVKTYLGFDTLDESEDEEELFTSGGWREGRTLIEQELGGGSYGVLGTPAGRGLGGERSPVGARIERGRGERRGLTVRDEEDEEEEGEREDGALLGFMKRVKNTVDVNLPRPGWFEGFGAERRGSGSGGRGREGQRGGVLGLFGGTGGVRI